MSESPRILPSEWVVTSTEASWGLVFGEDHPKFESHGHLDPEVHSQTDEITLRIVAQVDRVLELLFLTHLGEIQAIGLLSRDCRTLVLNGPFGHATYHIDGNTMTGHSHYKMNGVGKASEEYGVGITELTARS